MEGRVIIWFSCGAASAVAAKFGTEKYPDAHVVYCDLFYSEHPDNRRFFSDVERWIGKPIEIIRSTKFANIEESFEPKGYGNGGYMSGRYGAQCTREMKAYPRRDYQLPNDLHIFGLCADEGNRIAKFEKHNPDLEFEWLLRDRDFTHKECQELVASVIPLPAMYSLGFNNNNCIGCVKSQSPAYWNRVRKYFPEIFQRRAEQSRRIGCRLIKIHGVRAFLDELPSDVEPEVESDIECGVICAGSEE